MDRVVFQKTIRVVEQKTTEVELELPDARDPVQVLVQDEDERPMLAAQVTVLSLDPAVPLRQTYFTDEEGVAEFEQARGLPLRVVVEAPNSTRGEQQLDGAPERITVTLRAGVIVAGVVTSVRGRQYVEGATVTLVSGGRRQVAFTDREGVFRIADVPAGAARVLVSHADYAASEVSVQVQRTGRADRPFELDPIDLSEPGVIEGRVVDSEDNPVMGARVAVGMVPAYLPVGSLPEGMTITDMQGRFKLVGVSPGAVNVEAYAPEAGRGTRSAVPVTEGRTTEDVVIRLRAEGVADEPAGLGNLAVTLGERGRDPIEVVIVHVADGSEAERGSLAPGDVILSIDGAEPTSMLDARARLSGRAGSDVVLEIARGGAVHSLRVGRERVRR
jgi:membrane-associated protease RseP (regulator of RpoE activity)